MATGWSNEESFKFIELYQTCPEIWNPKHKYHKDKNKVNDAWTRIADEMLVPVGEIKKKKDALLAAFRLNHKKVVASRKSGAGESDVYKPIWIFYDALAAFMSDDVYECKSILTTENSADVKEDDDEIPDTQPSPRPQESQNSSQVSIPVQKRRSNNPPELAETSAQMKSALSTLNDALKKSRVEKVNEDDDCDLYGRLLANVLRQFNEIDRLELRHEIDGLIIKKKRSLISRRYVSSPSQIILSTNRSSPSHSIYGHQQMADDYPSSPYVHENRLIHRPSSSRSMYSSPSPSPKRIHNQQNMSRHVYAVASPPDFQTIDSQQNMSPYVYGIVSPPDYEAMESQQNTSQHVYAVASPPDCQAMESQQNTSQHVYVVASPPDGQAMKSQQNTSQHVYAVASTPCQEDQSSDILLRACLNAKIKKENL